MHVHTDPALDIDHEADPYDQLLRAGICRRCGRPTTEPPTTDRAFHERNALRGQTDPEGALAELDARYHDHLPADTNCVLCGVEHSAIYPSLLR